jgi:hypothetical protein
MPPLATRLPRRCGVNCRIGRWASHQGDQRRTRSQRTWRPHSRVARRYQRRPPVSTSPSPKRGMSQALAALSVARQHDMLLAMVESIKAAVGKTVHGGRPYGPRGARTHSLANARRSHLQSGGCGFDSLRWLFGQSVTGRANRRQPRLRHPQDSGRLAAEPKKRPRVPISDNKCHHWTAVRHRFRHRCRQDVTDSGTDRVTAFNRNGAVWALVWYPTCGGA